jgi:hypothetical protein
MQRPAVGTDQKLFRKKTFKLPEAVTERLRERSVQTRRYQYVLVTEALQKYLAGAPADASAEHPETAPRATPRQKRRAVARVLLAPWRALRALWAGPNSPA